MRATAPALLAILFAAVSVVGLTACGGSAGPRISVSPSVALIDQPVRISVTGLRAHERVVLYASTKDRFGKPFVSEASATADESGRVELSGDRGMRLLWSVRPPGLPAWQSYYTYDAPPRGMLLRLRAASATATVIRRFRAPGVHLTKLRPARSGFYGDFFPPPTSFRGQRPAILYFGGSEGGLHTFGAALQASHGYPTLALAYFREPGLPRNLLRIPLEYFARALRWLASQPGVDPRKIVVEGGSRGTEAAQLLGIHYPRLVHGVIALSPSDGSVCGIKPIITGTQSYRCAGPAWTFRGKPVPYIDGTAIPFAPHPFPDERIDGPIFLVCGGQDNLWPSCPMSERIVARLHAHHFQHKVTLLRYPAAGHGVGSLIPYYPGPDPQPLAGQTPQANQIGRANAWPKLQAFLRAIANS